MMQGVSHRHSTIEPDSGGQERLLLCVILLAGFVLRVWGLGAQSLWYDEGVTAWLAQMSLLEMVRWTADDIQPPLAYALTSLWSLLAGRSEYALRFLPLIFSTLTIAFLYALVRTWMRLLRYTGNAPLWVALLAALHPLYMYYAQEARMYAQLGALIVLAAWLLAPACFGAMPWRRWLGYAVVMALAAYTHYFAFFALLAFAVGWLWVRLASTKPERSEWVRIVAANLLVLLLFAPWIGVMVQRLGVDASYWQGDFHTVEAIRGVAQRFVTGETMRESIAVPLAMVVLLATVVLVVFAWRRDAALRPLLRFALCWLLIPVAAVILLASIAPKFNPRYVYLALGGLLLLWGAGLDWLTTTRSVPTRLSALGMMALLLVPMVWANGNWRFNGDFNKAQWREVAEYLRQRITPEERVILVSGHAFPVWEYYAPDIPAVRLPNIDVLDVNEVLTFANTAEPLRAALETHPGAWLVNWQEEVVDPNRVVSTQLELGGREKGLTATFNQLELERFSQIRTGRISDTPPISVTVGADFDGEVVLEGYRPLDNGDLLLFWSLPQSTDADYHFALEILDENGVSLRRVNDRRLAGYNYPTFRWQPDGVNMGRIPIEEWLGFSLTDFEEGIASPVADYQLRLRVYDVNDPSHTALPLHYGDAELLLVNVHPILE